MMTDWKLKLEWVTQREPLCSRARLRLVVNGKSFEDWITEIEASQGAEEIGGKYYFDLIRLVRAGRRSARFGGEVWALIGTCDSCGDPDCWPLEARVEVKDGELRILEFQNPRRKEWRYDEITPLVLPWPGFRQILAKYQTGIGVLPWGFPSDWPVTYPSIRVEELSFPPERGPSKMAQFFSQEVLEGLAQIDIDRRTEEDMALADGDEWERNFYNHWCEVWGIAEFDCGDRSAELKTVDWPPLKTLRKALEQTSWSVILEEWGTYRGDRRGKRTFIEVRFDLGDFPLRLQLEEPGLLRFEAPFWNPRMQAPDWFSEVYKDLAFYILQVLTRIHPGLGIRWGWADQHYWSGTEWDWLVAYTAFLLPKSSREVADYLEELVSAVRDIQSEMKYLLGISNPNFEERIKFMFSQEG